MNLFLINAGGILFFFLKKKNLNIRVLIVICRYDSVNETFENYKGLRLDVDRARKTQGTPLIAWNPSSPVPINQRFYLLPL